MAVMLGLVIGKALGILLFSWAAVRLGLAKLPEGCGLGRKRLEGTWTMVSGEKDGTTLAEETIKTAKLVIKGDKHDFKIGDETFKGTLKIDSSKKPTTIDATDTEGPFKGKTLLGIYELEGANFKVCFAEPGKNRPKEFSTKSGTGHIMYVWKKDKK